MREKLGLHCDVISGYAFSTSDWKEEGIPVVKIGNISNGADILCDEQMQYVDGSFLDKLDEKYHISEGDILISLTGSHINQPNSMVGRSCRSLTDKKYLLNQRAGKVIPFDNTNKDYLYYLLSTKAVKYDIANRAYGGANQVNVSPKDIKKIKWDFPRLDIQEKISCVLSTYDELIENNNKRIKLLEQMAENLYKEWFVRFRFPNHENTELENGIPKGWGYVKLDKVLTVLYGKDHSKLEDGDVPVYGSGGIMRYGNRALYEGESVLIPRKGTLNNIMWVNQPFWTVDTMFYTKALIPNVEKYIYYVLSALDMASFNTGAALPSMTTDILYHLKIVVPSAELLAKFDDFVTKLYEQRTILKIKNYNLIKQRDLLLPRLMSGKLEV